MPKYGFSLTRISLYQDRIYDSIHTRGEMCPNMVFFLVRILLRISPYSFRMREHTDQKNSLFGHFSHIVRVRENWYSSILDAA